MSWEAVAFISSVSASSADLLRPLLLSVATHPPALLTCRYAGTWDAIRRIWAEEGPGGYFKGMQAKILQTALNAALMLMIKEQVGRLGCTRSIA